MNLLQPPMELAIGGFLLWIYNSSVIETFDFNIFVHFQTFNDKLLGIKSHKIH